MGIIDKFKNLVGIEDIEDDEYEQEVKAAKESKPVDRGHDRKALDINKAKSFASSQRAQTSAEGKVLNMQNRTQLGSEERRVGKECGSRWSPYH